PGNWTPAAQIQNNDNTRLIWISPLDNASGANARVRTGATGLDFYVGGTTTDTGTLALTLNSSGNTYVNGELDTNGTEIYINRDGPATNESIYFYDDTYNDEFLRWEPTPDRFIFSNDLYVTGDISAGSYTTLDGRYVNVPGDTMTGNLNIAHTANPGLELRDTDGGTPFVDFSNDNAIDYDGRIILSADDTLTVDGAGLTLNNGGTVDTLESGWSGWNVALKFPNTSHAALFYPQSGLLFGMHSNGNFYWGNTIGSYYAMTLSNTGNLNTTGDVTVSGGDIYLPDANTRLTEGNGNALRMQTNSGYVDIGPQNTGWSHFSTDRASFYFNTKVTVDGNAEPYTDNARDLGASALRWRRLYLKGSPAEGTLVPNQYQTKIGVDTSYDNQWQQVLCDSGYAITNFSVYSTNYPDGLIRLTCAYVGDLLNTGVEGWYGDSGTCDNCWHSSLCPAGYIARGYKIYASGRLDTNQQLYCTQIASGNYTSTDWISYGANDQGDDDAYQGTGCPAGTYMYGITVYAASYPDGDWMSACRSIRP
ncbi:MAG: hypothetical protein WCX65_13990, partial [bacterium]